MKLSEKNGLKRYLDEETGTSLEMYYHPDKLEVVIFNFGTGMTTRRMQALALDYIGMNRLDAAYSTITIYSDPV